MTFLYVCYDLLLSYPVLFQPYFWVFSAGPVYWFSTKTSRSRDPPVLGVLPERVCSIWTSVATDSATEQEPWALTVSLLWCYCGDPFPVTMQCDPGSELGTTLAPKQRHCHNAVTNALCCDKTMAMMLLGNEEFFSLQSCGLSVVHAIYCWPKLHCIAYAYILHTMYIKIPHTAHTHTHHIHHTHTHTTYTIYLHSTCIIYTHHI